jgi:predicted GIY-YIG superfamily endonuclease
MWIYVLELAGGKFYIGRTNHIGRRYGEHLLQKAAAWTTKYPVQGLFEQRVEQTIYDEESVTREYMSRFGRDNVRGGPWVTLKLPANMENPFLLNRHRQGWCVRCGGNHFVYGCTSNVSQDGGPIFGYEKREEYPSEREISDWQEKNSDVECGRCGRNTHSTDRCFAKTDLEGNDI